MTVHLSPIVRRLDPQRLAAVRATGLLDSEIEEVFDRLTRLAVRLARVPAAFISLVDENRDFYKSACGFGEPLASDRELRGPTFCHYTIEQSDPLIIPDTAGDPVYRDVPTVRTLGVAAYVGIPLTVDGQTIGAFCAIDVKPRAWTADDVEVLVELAASAQREIAARAATAAAERIAETLRDQAAELEAQTEELQVMTEELRERTEVAEAATGALTESELRYRTMAQSVPVQVWTATPDGALDFVNECALQFFEAPQQSLLGFGWTRYVHPDDFPAAAEKWAAALANGTPYQTEFRLRDGAGAYRWHIARALPVRGLNGSVMGWSGSNTDVEGERAARAEAEGANRSKIAFLTTMSHELRTPLNAIGGYAQLLEAGVKGEINHDQRDFLQRLRRAQQRLLGLINGILNYAKVEAGTVDYADEQISANELLASCESLTAPLVVAGELTLRYSPAEPDVVARGDREKVAQIVLNLLSNAIKFTEPGGTIRITAELTGDQNVAIAVVDTGAGIALDDAARLFQPFVQLASGRSRASEGTGLGLAISREMARAMGGDLRVESVVGSGSTFTLTLPRG